MRRTLTEDFAESYHRTSSHDLYVSLRHLHICVNLKESLHPDPYHASFRLLRRSRRRTSILNLRAQNWRMRHPGTPNLQRTPKKNP